MCEFERVLVVVYTTQIYFPPPTLFAEHVFLLAYIELFPFPN
jgi:hypothetical protein